MVLIFSARVCVCMHTQLHTHPCRHAHMHACMHTHITLTQTGTKKFTALLYVISIRLYHHLVIICLVTYTFIITNKLLTDSRKRSINTRSTNTSISKQQKPAVVERGRGTNTESPVPPPRAPNLQEMIMLHCYKTFLEFCNV